MLKLEQILLDGLLSVWVALSVHQFLLLTPFSHAHS